MEFDQPDNSPTLTSKYYLGVALLTWTLVVAASLALNLWQADRGILETALHTARINYEKDILYRRWNASHGGVYIKTDKDTPPTPGWPTSPRETSPPPQAST